MKNRMASFPSFLAQCLVVVVKVDGRWRENGKYGLQREALFVRHARPFIKAISGINLLGFAESGEASVLLLNPDGSATNDITLSRRRSSRDYPIISYQISLRREAEADFIPLFRYDDLHVVGNMLMPSIMERLRQLVGSKGWDYCILWKSSQDQRCLEWGDCCCAGVEGTENGGEEHLFLLPQALPCRDVMFQHPISKPCELLALSPSSMPLDGMTADALISNQAKWLNFAKISDVSEDQHVINFVVDQCNMSMEEEAMSGSANVDLSCLQSSYLSENGSKNDYLEEANNTFRANQQLNPFKTPLANATPQQKEDKGGMKHDLVQGDSDSDQFDEEDDPKWIKLPFSGINRLCEGVAATIKLTDEFVSSPHGFYMGAASKSGSDTLKRSHDSDGGNDKGQQMEVLVDVSPLEGHEVYIKVFGKQRRGGFVRLMEAVSSLGLEITNVTVTSCISLMSYAFVVKRRDGEAMQVEYLRESLLEASRNQSRRWMKMTKVLDDGVEADHNQYNSHLHNHQFGAHLHHFHNFGA
ncbi:Transcription factor ABORTED MICROSPORES-like protein [Drosera capensis]